MSETLVEIRRLSRHFETGAEDLVVLRELDLDVVAGDSIAITGASGSGKSTLLSLIGGLDRADSGSIRAGTWLLHEVSEQDLAAYRSRFVGFVFQFHYLIKDFTALENVALPAMMAGMRRSEAFRRAADLLGGLSMGDRLHHLPSRLSGGERQRAAIARALVNAPPLIIADEPTGNLDAANARAVRELLFSLPGRHGSTLILATHDLDLAGEATRRLHLAEGRLSVR